MQLMGVYREDLVEPMAQVLSSLGVVRGLVVNGSDGLDEATMTGATHMCEIREGKFRTYDLTPEAGYASLHVTGSGGRHPRRKTPGFPETSLPAG